PYELRAVAADGRRGRDTVAIGEGESDLALELAAPDPYRGLIVVKVVDPDRQPVAGAEVTAAVCDRERGAIGWNGTPPIAGRTGRDGVFRFDDPDRLERMLYGMVLARLHDRVGLATVNGQPWAEVVVDR